MADLTPELLAQLEEDAAWLSPDENPYRLGIEGERTIDGEEEDADEMTIYGAMDDGASYEVATFHVDDMAPHAVRIFAALPALVAAAKERDQLRAEHDLWTRDLRAEIAEIDKNPRMEPEPASPDLKRDLAEVMRRFLAGIYDPADGAAQETRSALERAGRVIHALRTSNRRRKALPLQVAVALALEQGWELVPPPRPRADLARCEVCSALRGSRCRTADGQPAKRPHLGRAAAT